jgi:spore germination cell wall hydrolase CwlJ-like protein
MISRTIAAIAFIASSYGLIYHTDAFSQSVPEPVVEESTAVIPNILDYRPTEKVLAIIDQPPVNQPTKMSKQHVEAEMWLRAVMFGECRSCGKAGMTAVGHVALNRVRANKSTRYGAGLTGVINKRKQFSCLNKNDPNRKLIEAAMRGELDPESPEGKSWELAGEIAHTLMHRHVADPTHGATYYHTKKIHPKWADDHGMKRVVAIAGHVFYRKDA